MKIRGGTTLIRQQVEFELKSMIPADMTALMFDADAVNALKQSVTFPRILVVQILGASVQRYWRWR